MRNFAQSLKLNAAAAMNASMTALICFAFGLPPLGNSPWPSLLPFCGEGQIEGRGSDGGGVALRQMRRARYAGKAGSAVYAFEQRVELVAQAAAFQRPLVVHLVGEQACGHMYGLGSLGFEDFGHFFHIVVFATAGEYAGKLGVVVELEPLDSIGQAGDAPGQRTFFFIFFTADDADFGHEISRVRLGRLWMVRCEALAQGMGSALVVASGRRFGDFYSELLFFSSVMLFCTALSSFSRYAA